MSVLDWSSKAACIGMSPDKFDVLHPDFDLSLAKEACTRCPVRRLCLQNAIVNKEYEHHLVWGGGSPSQVARIARYSYHGREALLCEKCGADRDFVRVLDEGWRYCCKPKKK